jgi:hypothetical protein
MRVTLWWHSVVSLHFEHLQLLQVRVGPPQHHIYSMPPKPLNILTSVCNRGQKHKTQGASGALHEDSDSDVDHLPAVAQLLEAPLPAANSLTHKDGSAKSLCTPQGASGAIHIDSDDDCHVKTSLHIDSSSQCITTSYQAFSTKRQRTGATITQAVPIIDSDKQPIETPDEVKKRKQVRSILQ